LQYLPPDSEEYHSQSVVENRNQILWGDKAPNTAKTSTV
jgi:hypothetical protein